MLPLNLGPIVITLSSFQCSSIFSFRCKCLFHHLTVLKTLFPCSGHQQHSARTRNSVRLGPGQRQPTSFSKGGASDARSPKHVRHAQPRARRSLGFVSRTQRRPIRFETRRWSVPKHGPAESRVSGVEQRKRPAARHRGCEVQLEGQSRSAAQGRYGGRADSVDGAAVVGSTGSRKSGSGNQLKLVHVTQNNGWSVYWGKLP